MMRNNKRGELNVGVIVLLFMGIIVALSLISGGISNNVAVLTKTNPISNDTVTFPAANASITLKGQAARDVILINATGQIVIPSANYTITNYVVSNGQLVTTLTAPADQVAQNGKAVNISYTSEPFGYDTNAGNRSVHGLILIFAALAVAIFVISRVLDTSLLDLLDR